MRLLAVAAISTLLVGCDPERVQLDAETSAFLSMYKCPSAPGSYEASTVAELTTHPERFNGKAIKVSGYYTHSFEHSAIYSTPQDPFSATFSEGLWTLMSTDKSPDSGDHVTLRGIYTTSTRGHLGQWPGSICVHSVSVSNES